MVENILWPAYFDADRTRSEGRRVAESMAVSDPSLDEIAKAVQQVGYDATIQPDKAYPRDPLDVTGRVAVQNADDAGKGDMIQAVAAYIEALRD